LIVYCSNLVLWVFNQLLRAVGISGPHEFPLASDSGAKIIHAVVDSIHLHQRDDCGKALKPIGKSYCILPTVRVRLAAVKVFSDLVTAI
jgi:hypothetical protein